MLLEISKMSIDQLKAEILNIEEMPCSESYCRFNDCGMCMQKYCTIDYDSQQEAWDRCEELEEELKRRNNSENAS
jgi:hypothetical protein